VGKTKKIELTFLQPAATRLLPTLQKYKAALIVLLAGILLLLSSRSATPSTQTAAQSQSQAQAESFNLATFEQELNKQLAAIEGAGRVSLMLSLDTTEEAVYAVNVRQSATPNSSSSYESNVTIRSDGSYGEVPVTVKNKMPAFRGAVVLCDGADNAAVRLAITQAVSTVCGIGSDKVTVLKMAADA